MEVCVHSSVRCTREGAVSTGGIGLWAAAPRRQRMFSYATASTCRVRLFEVRGGPAIEVVLGHALFGQGAHLLGASGMAGDVQGVEAALLVAAGVVDLVQFVARTEFGADRVPQQLEGLGAFFGVDAIGAAGVLVQERSHLGVEEVLGVGWQVDQAAGHGLRIRLITRL